MRLFLTTCALLLTAMPARAEPDYRAMTLAAVDLAVVPGYESFRDRAAALDRSAGEFCASPDARDLEPLRRAFHGAMDAWQSVQLVSYGPVEEFHRGQRVHFWPDKKGAGDRQMRQLLKDGTAEPLLGNRIAFASVAIQGLPALETLVFTDGDKLAGGADAAVRCQMVTAIAGNLARIGAELAGAWTGPKGYRTVLAQAGAPASPYADSRQAAAQLFNALHGHLEAVAEVKLAHPMGGAPEAARRQRAESWRSERSLRNITQNLQAVRAVIESALLPVLPQANAARLADALASAETAAQAVPGTLEGALETEAGWQAMATLKARVKDLGRALEAEAGAPLGMAVGFNGLDGD